MDEKTIPFSKLPVDVRVMITGEKSLGLNLDYRALFEQTGECVFIIGLDLRFITANQQALRLLGYEEYQLLGLPVEDIMLMDDFNQPGALFERHLSISESTLRRKNGTLLPVEVSISVVHNAAGLPTHIQMLARDISERKQAEVSLKRHMRALSVIGDATAGLFRSADIQAAIPAVLALLGHAVDMFCCALFTTQPRAVKVQYQWVNREDAGFDIAAALVPFLDAIAESPTRVFSATRVKLDHTKIPAISILVIPIQGAFGSLGYLALFDKQNQLSWLTREFDTIQTIANLIGAALDRIRYEHTIQLSEMRNRVIVDALPDLLMRVDLTGRILDYNANPSHPLYRSPALVIGKKLAEVWTPEVVKMILETEAPNAFVSSHWVSGFNLPGHTQTFEARLHPISSDEALIVVRDITEQAHLDQMKSDFINRASHELRTPLTAAIMMVELLQQGGTKEETAEYLGALASELDRQKELINQLLLAGRLESGGMELAAVPMNLMQVLRESILAVKVIASKRNIQIKIQAAEDSITVLGDRSGLSQVFINLINNAVKFSPAGKAVEVIVTKDAEHASITIADHGLGIPSDSIPHLFERFYRARNVTVAEIPGSGIGLYIVKSIVDEL
ncbi:MAG: PAS domain S-box protein, partial [Chloroflexota bacterium]